LTALRKRTAYPVVLRMTGELSDGTIPDEVKDLVFQDHFLPREDMPAFYSSLDYYLCTSEIEGYGYPVLEAMCCERIVVSTPVGVIPEIIHHAENGFILKAEDFIDSFVKIVNDTFPDDDSVHHLGKSARNTILSTLSWHSILQNNQYPDFFVEADRHFHRVPLHLRVKNVLKAHVDFLRMGSL
jgi:glycosyltransferase involved in cell wall biosynthesis